MTFCTQMILQNLLKLHRLRKLNDRHYPFIVNSPDYPLTSRPPTNLPVPTNASLARLSVRLATFIKQMMHDFGQTQVRLYCRRRTNSDLCRHGKSSSEILSHLRICLEPDPKHDFGNFLIQTDRDCARKWLFSLGDHGLSLHEVKKGWLTCFQALEIHPK